MVKHHFHKKSKSFEKPLFINFYRLYNNLEPENLAGQTALDANYLRQLNFCPELLTV